MRNALLFLSKFRKGPPANIENIDGNFLTEFVDCLLTKGPENTLGFEVIQTQVEKMIDVVGNGGSE